MLFLFTFHWPTVTWPCQTTTKIMLHTILPCPEVRVGTVWQIALRAKTLTSRVVVPNLFAHQAPILWKTIFLQTRVEGDDCFYYYYYINSISDHQTLDPGDLGILLWRISLNLLVLQKELESAQLTLNFRKK